MKKKKITTVVLAVIGFRVESLLGYLKKKTNKKKQMSAMSLWNDFYFLPKSVARQPIQRKCIAFLYSRYSKKKKKK